MTASVAAVADVPQVPIEVVTSAGAHDVTVALLRDFVHASGALRAVAALDRGADLPPVLIDCGRFLPIEVDLGDRILQLDHAAPLLVTPPAIPHVHQQPAFEVDSGDGKVTGAIGGLEHLAGAVRALAGLLGERSVAVATFETTNAELPLALSARASGTEPVVVTLGDQSFEIA